MDEFIDWAELKFKRMAKWFNKIGLNGPRSLVLFSILYIWFIIGTTFVYGWAGLLLSAVAIPIFVVVGLTILVVMLLGFLEFVDDALGPLIDWLRSNWNRNVGKQDD